MAETLLNELGRKLLMATTGLSLKVSISVKSETRRACPKVPEGQRHTLKRWRRQVPVRFSLPFTSLSIISAFIHVGMGPQWKGPGLNISFMIFPHANHVIYVLVNQKCIRNILDSGQKGLNSARTVEVGYGNLTYEDDEYIWDWVGGCQGFGGGDGGLETASPSLWFSSQLVPELQ